LHAIYDSGKEGSALASMASSFETLAQQRGGFASMNVTGCSIRAGRAHAVLIRRVASSANAL